MVRNSYDTRGSKQDSKKQLNSPIGQINSMGFVMPVRLNQDDSRQGLTTAAAGKNMRDPNRFPTKPDFRSTGRTNSNAMRQRNHSHRKWEDPFELPS